jgi:PAS domain-containing protein
MLSRGMSQNSHVKLSELTIKSFHRVCRIKHNAHLFRFAPMREREHVVFLCLEAEEQLQMLVDSSPAAIVTVGSYGEILLANDAAQELFNAGVEDLRGKPIGSYIPALHTAMQSGKSGLYRTAIHCHDTKLSS